MDCTLIDFLDLLFNFLTTIALIFGLIYAVYKLGLKRVRFSSLQLTVKSKTLFKSHNLSLVVIKIGLQNVGNTRINERKIRRTDGYLYNDHFDNCLHAGTLKIRAIPIKTDLQLIDWYSLFPLQSSTPISAGQKTNPVADLDNINYLDEYQDPATNYKEVDFWLEPRESYECSVPVWLPQGVYAVKAIFLGSITKHGEEEYWSCLTVFDA